MASYLAWLRHPDGRVPLLNDGGMHALCEPARMFRLGRHQGLGLDASFPEGGKLFPDAGVVAWHGDPWVVFFDVGAIGADHVPGHGHADTLTLECSLGGRRLFVDPGTFAYDRDERRQYDRSTSSHNTVCIDGADSSEVWDLFRVGRRAMPAEVRVAFDERTFEASATHTGYAHLPGRPAHRRRVTLGEDGTLLLADMLEGRGEHGVRGGLLVDPAWTVEPEESGWRLACDGRGVRVRVRGRGAEPALDLVRAPYHPDYGVEVTTRRLVWACRATFPLEVYTEIVPA
jgi:uncharacterized heparinase superfamily protein